MIPVLTTKCISSSQTASRRWKHKWEGKCQFKPNITTKVPIFLGYRTSVTLGSFPINSTKDTATETKYSSNSNWVRGFKMKVLVIIASKVTPFVVNKVLRQRHSLCIWQGSNRSSLKLSTTSSKRSRQEYRLQRVTKLPAMVQRTLGIFARGDHKAWADNAMVWLLLGMLLASYEREPTIHTRIDWIMKWVLHENSIHQPPG